MAIETIKIVERKAIYAPDPAPYDPYYKWGFDLSSFGSFDKFKKWLSDNNFAFIVAGSTHQEYGIQQERFIFLNNKGVLLITAHSGYTDPSSSDEDDGYVGYVGLTSVDKTELMKVVKSFKEKADYKDESKNARDFI